MIVELVGGPHGGEKVEVRDGVTAIDIPILSRRAVWVEENEPFRPIEFTKATYRAPVVHRVPTDPRAVEALRRFYWQAP